MLLLAAHLDVGEKRRRVAAHLDVGQQRRGVAAGSVVERRLAAVLQLERHDRVSQQLLRDVARAELVGAQLHHHHRLAARAGQAAAAARAEKAALNTCSSTHNLM